VTCWSTAEDRCLLFLEYDYLKEAYQTAIAAQLKHWMPFIGYRAAALGRLDIMHNCVKLL
jgi:hypothetical protein